MCSTGTSNWVSQLLEGMYVKLATHFSQLQPLFLLTLCTDSDSKSSISDLQYLCLGTRLHNYICEQINVRFLTSLDHWLFQDGCQIRESTEAGLTVHAGSWFSKNVLLYHSFIMDFNFCYCSDPLDRHAIRRLSCWRWAISHSIQINNTL